MLETSSDEEHVRRVADVPDTCRLGPTLLLAVLLMDRDPCLRCNHDRKVCGGRPRKEDR